MLIIYILAGIISALSYQFITILQQPFIHRSDLRSCLISVMAHSAKLLRLHRPLASPAAYRYRWWFWPWSSFFYLDQTYVDAIPPLNRFSLRGFRLLSPILHWLLPWCRICKPPVCFVVGQLGLKPCPPRLSLVNRHLLGRKSDRIASIRVPQSICLVKRLKVVAASMSCALHSFFLEVLDPILM